MQCTEVNLLERFGADSGDKSLRYDVPEICIVCERVKPLLVNLVFTEGKVPSKANVLEAGVTEAEIDLLREYHVFGSKDDVIFINWKYNKYFPGASIAESIDKTFSIENLKIEYRKELERISYRYDEIASTFHMSWSWVEDLVNKYFEKDYDLLNLLYSNTVIETFEDLYDDIQDVIARFGNPSFKVFVAELHDWVNYRYR